MPVEVIEHIKTFNKKSKSFAKAKWLISTLVLGMFLLAHPANAQVTSKIDTTSIRIGEQMELEITVDRVKDVRFAPFQFDSLQRIEVVTSYPIDSLKNQLIKRYAITSFDSGQYVLPSQIVFVKDKKVLTDSILIDVGTVAVDTIKQPMHHIKSINPEPYTFDDFKKYIWWLMALAALIALILFFVNRGKKKKVEVEVIVPPFELAKQRLQELDGKELWQQNKVKQYYVELTDIVRTFIEKEMNIPALESTTDELLTFVNDFNQSSQLDIPNETIAKLKSLLKEADLVKFAKMQPMSNIIEHHRTEAEQIIDKLHPLAKKHQAQLDEDALKIDTNNGQ